MKTDQFLENLGLDADAPLDQVEGAFVESVKMRAQAASETFDEAFSKQEERALQEQAELFFSYSLQWAARHIKGQQKKAASESKEVKDLKKQARDTIQDLQDYITRFLVCYMYLHHYTTLLWDEIRAEENRVSMSGTTIKWTADSGVMIARQRKRKKALVKRLAQFKQASGLLQETDQRLESLKNNLYQLFGKERADPMIRSFNAALRTLDHKKATQLKTRIDKEKKRFGLDQSKAAQLQKNTAQDIKMLLAIMETHEDTLKDDEGRAFLRPIEADLAYNANIRELRKIKAYLSKYHLPYMQYKLDTLAHLKDKLLVIHSMETLMTLYSRLIKGIAAPMDDIKDIRLFESDVLQHIRYLLDGHFQELPNILERADNTVREFRQSQHDLDSIQSLDLQEIPTGQVA